MFIPEQWKEYNMVSYQLNAFSNKGQSHREMSTCSVIE